MAGHGHAIDIDRFHAGRAGRSGRDFGGGDILALPAEGVADAVHKIEKALCVLAHQVAAAYPGITRREHIAQDLLLGGGRVGIALKTGRAACDLADGLAAFAACHGAAQTIRAAFGKAGFIVELHDGCGKTVCQERRDAADGAGAAFDIVEREIAFGGGIEFQDLWDGEAVLEDFPHIARQPIADRQAQSVFRHLTFAGQQIAAQFADILEDGGAAVGHIAPEGAGGEFLAQDHRAAAQQHRARRHHAPHAVIHGQAVVEPVVRPRAGHAGEPVGPAHHPAMADMGRLGQAGGAGGIDQKGAVVQRDIAIMHQRFTGKAFQKPREGLAIVPKLRRGGQIAAPAFGRDDMGGRGHGDAMTQRLALQVGVQQRHDSADGGDAQPDRQIVGAIGQEQANGIALADVLGQRPARYLVDARRQPGMGERLVRGDQRRGFAEARPQFLDHGRQDARGRVLDLRRHFQRAQPGLGSGRRLAGQGKSHLVSQIETGVKCERARLARLAWKPR